jgi:peptide chain release factor 1
MRGWRVGGFFEIKLLEARRGFVSFFVKGQTADIFKGECGGHRWQRIPPTESKGRVHTSTVTVAVLELDEIAPSFDEQDITISTTRGSGKGGQNRNKLETCVVVKHLPTGLMVRAETERSQYQNKQIALQILKSKLKAIALENGHVTTNELRARQIGSGMRGDKIRTYRERDNLVIDHRTNRKFRLDSFVNGQNTT